ncbi:NifU family protein [Tenuifilum osseticum]|uniref:NifU family protein n=1 Tax=Tenuifilum TaxID=2760873 RepID=UPI001B50E4F1|nr:NifU family protein [Bacteroidales bacterium]HOK60405.1 NifU family protein [Tenuifilum sp.]MBP9030389.1 NifU family protein [Bacteroidales bacterium]HOK85735.1 NifU family protein [Tenuifilum sp.]HON70602.1 NifU family protein [Tenuifilum sp.]
MSKEQVVAKVEKAIEVIRPFLQNDGGDISLVEVTDDYIVKVKLHGACGSCPYSIMTLKNGVEQAIIRDVPEIKEVVAVNLNF